MEENTYSWTFDDNKNRSGSWYIIFLSIMIGLVLWGFFTKQYGMSFVIILLSGLIYFVDNNSDDNVNIQVSELGIKVSEKFYDFPKIQSYGFIYDGEQAIYLRLKLINSAISHIDLGVNNQITTDLRPLLANYIAEAEDSKLSLVEKTLKILKL